jgi:hypothetical protein
MTDGSGRWVEQRANWMDEYLIIGGRGGNYYGVVDSEN